MRRLGGLGLVWVLGCAAQPGGAERPDFEVGSGGVATALCTASDGCASCSGCIERCTCLTGNAAQCPEACGEQGGSGPGGGGSGGVPEGGSGGGGAGGGAPPGGGGIAGTGGSSGGGTSAGGTSGGGTSGGGTSAGGAGGTGGGSTCPYPSGPYGTTVGAVVSPTLSWQGYREDDAQLSSVAITDYFDCDGKRGIHALLITQDAVWCSACKEEASELNSHMVSWAPKGIRVLSLVIEDLYGYPATTKTAKQWKDAFQAKGWAVAADPDFTFSSSGSNGLPTIVIVDPRTMKIVSKTEGAGSYSKLEQLAATNKP